PRQDRTDRVRSTPASPSTRPSSCCPTPSGWPSSSSTCMRCPSPRPRRSSTSPPGPSSPGAPVAARPSPRRSPTPDSPPREPPGPGPRQTDEATTRRREVAMTDDQDQDPTGMSHLLAGLKETGPMPDDLNDRIRASLADEQAARATEAPDAHEEAEDRAEDEDERSTFWAGMDTDERRPRRRTSTAGRWVLGVAAAAVLVMGIGGVFAIRGDDGAPSDSTASTASENSAEGSDEPGAGSAPSETPAFAVTE